ncbi:proline-rich transmembrane protein 3-like [Oncorhynchus tshawytscha]|uniref:Proline-rich transmembrane protein 3/4 domain-containing protein n=1 Tax=Oncorhynchus tshawytscha TaxID=74940 RepID=A0A8C8HF30_ONCTS|nr:proline-rich transmembrane protein 3-like [Oncorhynchus tshawytscha]
MVWLLSLSLVLATLFHCSPGNIIRATSTSPSSINSDHVPLPLFSNSLSTTSNMGTTTPKLTTTQQTGTDILLPTSGMQVPGNRMTSMEDLDGTLVGTSYGSDESMDDSGLGDTDIIESQQETTASTLVINSAPGNEEKKAKELEVHSSILTSLYPPPRPPKQTQDSVSTAGPAGLQTSEDVRSPAKSPLTNLTLRATSKLSLPPIGDDDSGLNLEPAYSIVEISKQSEPTVNSTSEINNSPNPLTHHSSHQSPKDTITEATLEEEEEGLGALEENEEEDVVVLKYIFVIDSAVPISRDTRGKLSHSSTLSSANPKQAPIVTGQFQREKEQTQSFPDIQSTELPAQSSPDVKHIIHQHEENTKGQLWPVPSVRYGVFGPVTHQNLNGGPCVLGLGSCVFPTGTNGTLLLWEDLSRTLAFAWELHVYGSAGLFLLLSCVAVLGMVGRSNMLHPLCDVLTLANRLLLLTGALRAVLLLTDPYGTRRILSRPVLTALYNLPLLLLLWAQVALAMILLSPTMQRPRVVGSLAILHCTLLLAADLLSPTLSHAFPLVLQSLSLCWGLTLCLGILTQSLSHLQPFSKTPIHQWGAPQRIEERARRVTAVCALLGVLCSGLQIYSLLWLYGLLGDWRRFGWGWWLGQFWARVLELFWGFSMLVLGSWVFWTPRRSRARSDHGQGMPERSSFWKILRIGPFRSFEKNWAELIPKNWAGQHHSGADSDSIRVYDNPPTTHSLRDTMSPSHHKGGEPTTSSSGDTHLLWQRVGERECILSLIEFDMLPQSPINLSRSIDNALHHDNGHLLGVGSLFTAPPSSTWTHQAGADTDTSLADSEIKPPSLTSPTSPTSPTSNVGCRWEVEAGSRPATSDHFRANGQALPEAEPKLEPQLQPDPQPQLQPDPQPQLQPDPQPQLQLDPQPQLLPDPQPQLQPDPQPQLQPDPQPQLQPDPQPQPLEASDNQILQPSPNPETPGGCSRQ